jgi:hypothetical protein
MIKMGRGNISIVSPNRIKGDIARSLKESTNIIKKNIRKELRDPNKTGVLKPLSRRRSGSPRRRSAPGESLARDTGNSERLISSIKISNTRRYVGFKKDLNGFDYLAFQENQRNRPTLQKAVAKSVNEIKLVWQKNLRPKS